MLGYFKKHTYFKNPQTINQNLNALVVFLDEFEISLNNHFNQASFTKLMNYNVLYCLWYTTNYNLRNQIDFLYYPNAEFEKLAVDSTIYSDKQGFKYALNTKWLFQMQEIVFMKSIPAVFLIKRFEFITNPMEMIDYFSEVAFLSKLKQTYDDSISQKEMIIADYDLSVSYENDKKQVQQLNAISSINLNKKKQHLYEDWNVWFVAFSKNKDLFDYIYAKPKYLKNKKLKASFNFKLGTAIKSLIPQCRVKVNEETARLVMKMHLHKQIQKTKGNYQILKDIILDKQTTDIEQEYESVV